MDFLKYLPKYLIIKNVLNIDNCTICKYLLAKAENIKLNKLDHKNIQSWHPLIIRDGNNFYYFKGLKKTDYAIASFCINNEEYESSFTNTILENYFNKKSFEL